MLHTHEVDGSSPPVSTKNNSTTFAVLLFLGFAPRVFNMLGRSESALRQGFSSKNACGARPRANSTTFAVLLFLGFAPRVRTKIRLPLCPRGAGERSEIEGIERPEPRTIVGVGLQTYYFFTIHYSLFTIFPLCILTKRNH